MAKPPHALDLTTSGRQITDLPSTAPIEQADPLNAIQTVLTIRKAMAATLFDRQHFTAACLRMGGCLLHFHMNVHNNVISNVEEGVLYPHELHLSRPNVPARSFLHWISLSINDALLSTSSFDAISPTVGTCVQPKRKAKHPTGVAFLAFVGRWAAHQSECLGVRIYEGGYPLRAGRAARQIQEVVATHVYLKPTIHAETVALGSQEGGASKAGLAK